jgi:hypothetical protein
MVGWSRVGLAAWKFFPEHSQPCLRRRRGRTLHAPRLIVLLHYGVARLVTVILALQHLLLLLRARISVPFRRTLSAGPRIAANLSSLPARKSYEKCADQRAAAKNRRLTRTTKPPLIRFVCLNYLSVRDYPMTSRIGCKPSWRNLESRHEDRRRVAPDKFSYPLTAIRSHAPSATTS